MIYHLTVLQYQKIDRETVKTDNSSNNIVHETINNRLHDFCFYLNKAKIESVNLINEEQNAKVIITPLQ